MKQQLWHWTLLILLLIMPLTTAMTLEEGSLTWNGEPVVYTNPKAPSSVSITFTLTEVENIDLLETITIDHQELNPRDDTSVHTTTLTPNQCVAQENTLTCFVIGKILKTDQSSITINVTVKNVTSEQQFSFTHSLTIDSTNPQVTSMTTDYCQEDVCYVKNGLNTVYIAMQDSLATFNRMRIAFMLSNSSAFVSSCEEMSCWGKTSISCTDGQRVPLKIMPYQGMPSQDDAGNALQGERMTRVVCDDNKPLIEEGFSLKTSSGLPVIHEEKDDYFVTLGDTLTITVNVTEKISPSLSIIARANNFGHEEPVEGSCRETTEEGQWQCSVAIGIDASELGTFNIPLVVEDFVGNKAITTLENVEIMQKIDGETDEWLISNPSRQVANRHYLEFTPKRVFLPITLTPKKSKQAIILSAEPTGVCKAIEKPSRSRNEEKEYYGTDADLEFKVISTTNQMIMIRGELGASEDNYRMVEKLKYNCSLEIRTLRGEYALLEPETENFIVEFKLINSSTLGEQVRREIEELENSTINSLSWVDETQTIITGLGALCSTGGALKGVGGGLGVVAAALDPIKQLEAISDTLGSLSEKLEGGIAEGSLEILNKACSILTCDLTTITGLMDTDLGETGVGEVMSDAGFSADEMLDPYSSFISSVATLCPSAMVYHLDAYTSLECNYISCLSKDVRAGSATIDQCKQTRSYGGCMQLWGGVYNTIPFYSFAEDIITTFLESLEDPVTFFGTYGITAICLFAGGERASQTLAGKVCYGVSGITGAYNSYKQVESIWHQVSAMFDGSMGESACNVVEERMDKYTTYWDYGYEDNIPEELYQVYDSNGNLIEDPDEVDKKCKSGGCTHCSAFGGCTSSIGEQKVTVQSGLRGGTFIYQDGEYIGGEIETLKDEARDELVYFDDELMTTNNKLSENMNSLLATFEVLGMDMEDLKYDGKEIFTITDDDGNRILEDNNLPASYFDNIEDQYDYMNELSTSLHAMLGNYDEYTSNKIVGSDGGTYIMAKDFVGYNDGDTTVTTDNVLNSYKPSLREYLETDAEGNIILDLSKLERDMQIANNDLETLEEIMGQANNKVATYKETIKVVTEAEKIADESTKQMQALYSYIQDSDKDYSKTLAILRDLETNIVSYKETAKKLEKEIADLTDEINALKNYEDAKKFNSGEWRNDRSYKKAKRSIERAYKKNEEELVKAFGTNVEKLFDDKGNILDDNKLKDFMESSNLFSEDNNKFIGTNNPELLDIASKWESFNEEKTKNEQYEETVDKTFKQDGELIKPDGYDKDEYGDLSVESIEEFKEDKKKEAKKEQRKAERELKQKELEAKAMFHIQQNWEGMSIVGSIFATQNSVNAITNWLAPDSSWDDLGLSGISETIDVWITEVSGGIEGQQCKKKLQTDSSSMKVNTITSGAATSAAFVAGLIMDTSNEEGTEGYEYAISVYVQNKEGNDDLPFEVRLQSSSDSSKTIILQEDDEGIAHKEVTLKGGETFAKTKDFIFHPFNPEDDPEPIGYDTVCIRFKVNNIKRWFDVSTSSKEFCRELEEG